MPKNEDTLAYFKRYAKFYLPNTDSVTKKTCWQVEATDSISTPGIIEVIATEDYSNVFLDDIANGIVDGLKEEPQDPTPNVDIEGETFIKAKRTYTYKYLGKDIPIWEYDLKLPIKIIEQKDNYITLKWDSNYRGQFDLQCNNIIKTIVVDSLF